jgi:oligosaccharide repeat unit polymerase
MLILAFFIFQLIIYYRYKSVATVFVVLQVLSLSLVIFVGRFYQIDTALKLFNSLFTIFILTIVINPWNYYRGIKEIYYFNEKRIKKFTIFLLLINLVMIVSLVFITIFILRFSDRINELKYSGGFSDLLYAQFPILVKGYLAAYYLHSLSYLLIILHFYYLGKQNARFAIFCFILSLNSVLFGLTYFSRVALFNYLLIYTMSFLLYKDVLSKKVQKKIRNVIMIFGAVLVSIFILITISRFDNDVSYKNKIPSYSKIKDPSLFSYFDYVSQWQENSMLVLNNYNFETFNGQQTFSKELKLLSQYGIIENNNYEETRKKLMPETYYKFNGLVADWVYDFGYVLTFILALIYYFIIRKLVPIEKSIPLKNAFLLVYLIQIPLFAIFYSGLGGIVFPLLLLIPIYFYLYTKRVRVTS